MNCPHGKILLQAIQKSQLLHKMEHRTIYVYDYLIFLQRVYLTIPKGRITV